MKMPDQNLSANSPAGQMPLLAELNNVQQQYQELFNYAHDGIVFYELENASSGGTFLQANPAICGLLGYTRDEMLQLTLLSVLAHEDHPITARDHDLLRREGVLRHEKSLLTKDGRRVPVEIIARWFEQKDRNMVMSMIRDLRERRQFDNVLDQLPAYLVLLSPDYRVPFANRFFEERFGKSEGRRCYEYLFNRTEPCEICETYTVLKTNAPHHWEWNGPDGRIYDIYDFPFKDIDGSPLIMEVGLDITTQKQAFQYARSLIEASLDPLVTISPDGKITDVNEAAIKVTGLPRDKLIGTDFSVYFTEPQKAQEGYQLVFSRGTVTDYPLTIRHKDGKLTDVLYNASVYKDASGSVLGVFAAARDITEIKRAQAALTDLNETLEQRIVERTVELQESKERYHSLFSNMTEGFAHHEIITDADGRPCDYRFLEVNPAFEQLTGIKRDDLIGRRVLEVLPDTETHWIETYGQVALTGRSTHFENYSLQLDSWYEVFAYQPAPRQFAAVFTDITKRKQAEANQSLLTDVLRILSLGGQLRPLIAEVLQIIRDRTGFEAVGLRLREGEDCPYYEYNGFSNEFVKEENFLCPHGGNRQTVRDADGQIMLECTCGLVLSGQTDPTMPCFTEGGSFWTNTSKELLSLPPKNDPRFNPRNTCIHAGYESFGLFPVRAGKGVIGLLQLNDRRPGRFAPEMITFYENLAQNIGMALHRTIAEEAMRKSEARFRLLSETAGRLLETDNPQVMVEELCKSVMEHLECDCFFNYLADASSGRLHLNACAGIALEEIRRVEWLDYGTAVCGYVAQTGRLIIAEYVQNTDDPKTEMIKNYGIRAYACHPLLSEGRVIGTLSFGTRKRPAFSSEDLILMKTVTDQVATAIQRILSVKALRESYEDLSRFNRMAVDRELRMIELKKEINEACRQAGLPARYVMDPQDQLPVPEAAETENRMDLQDTQ